MTKMNTFALSVIGAFLSVLAAGAAEPAGQPAMELTLDLGNQ